MTLTKKQIEDHKAWLMEQVPAVQGFIGRQLCDAVLAGMTADKDALVKHLQAMADDIELEANYRAYCAQAIALLTAPAEAPVAWQILSEGRSEGFCVRADVADERASKMRQNGMKSVTFRPLYAAPLPQSAPVSREAARDVLEDVLSYIGLDSTKYLSMAARKRLIENINAILAAHPAPSAGKDELDARRYRWLRADRHSLNDGLPFIAIAHVGGSGVSGWTDEHADKAIDAAIAGKDSVPENVTYPLADNWDGAHL